MSTSHSLLILGSLAVLQPLASAQDKKLPSLMDATARLVELLEKTSAFCSNGTVEDVFGDDLVLVSFGSDQGAKKGERLTIYRLSPKSEYVGIAQITEVGERHALARLTWRAARQGPKTEDRVVGDLKPLKPLPVLDRFRDFLIADSAVQSSSSTS